MTFLRRAALVALAVLAVAGRSFGEDPLPPVPRAYLNDYAGVIPDEAERALEAKLRLFDEQTSSQIVVALFPKLPSASMEDFTIRTAQSWGVGRTKLNNGVILFVFVQDHKLRLEVGYGLEGPLPDATANRIKDEVIVPRFRVGDYTAGISAGVDAIMAATRGEYKAPPRAASDPRKSESGEWLTLLVILVVLALVFRGGGGGGSRTFNRRGGYGGYYGGWVNEGWGGGGGGWGSGGGFGGGGFSGGGGSFGGGGASGDW